MVKKQQKADKDKKVRGAKHKQRTLKAIVTVSVIVMFLGTIFMVIVPSGNAGAEDNVWIKMEPNEKPSERTYHKMTYDSMNNLVILFGGVNSKGHIYETWVYDVATDTWQQKSPSTTPSATRVPAMTYDSANKKVVLFGGLDSDDKYMDETWIYDVGEDKWTQKFPSNKPSARAMTTMVYDSFNNKIILFAGWDGSKYLDDMWFYNVSSNTWTEKTQSTKPSARNSHAMVYDSENKKVILFGGDSGGGNRYDDTWVYDPDMNTWTEKTQSTKPSARNVHEMAYDSTNNKVVLFGGYIASSVVNNETWTYDYPENKWIQMKPSNKPPARASFAMCYDSKNNNVIVFGGRDHNLPDYFDDTWTYTYSSLKLTLESSQNSYYQGDLVTINATHDGYSKHHFPGQRH